MMMMAMIFSIAANHDLVMISEPNSLEASARYSNQMVSKHPPASFCCHSKPATNQSDCLDLNLPHPDFSILLLYERCGTLFPATSPPHTTPNPTSSHQFGSLPPYPPLPISSYLQIANFSDLNTTMAKRKHSPTRARSERQDKDTH